MKLNKIDKSLSAKFLPSLLLMVTAFLVHADDTEVFFTESEVNSNVLFVMDNSGSMSFPVTGTVAGPNDTTLASFPITHADDDAEENVNGSGRQRRTRTNSSDLGMVMDWKDDSASFRRNNSWQEQRVGLRFTDIGIPQGTRIVSAYIQFTADKDDYDMNSDAARLNIVVQAKNSAERYDHGEERDIDDRNYYNSDSVVWNPPPWTVLNQRGPAQKTPDLSAMVQMVINRNGWRANNAIAFKITGTGLRSAHAFKRNKNNQAALYIEYQSTGEKTRLQVMKGALKTVLANPPTNLNVGIMNYGSSTRDRWDFPNGVRFPAKRVNDLARPIMEEALTIGGVARWDLSNIPEPDATITVGNYLSQIADSWEAKGNTPIVDALYEAARYYRGDALYWGNGTVHQAFSAHPTTYVHPAPDAVLPRLESQTVEVCAGVPQSKTVSYYDGQHNKIADWDNGITGGYNCPENVSAPTGPGSAANCPATKFDSGRYEARGSCINYISSVYGPDVCNTVDGVESCVRGPRIRRGYCEGDRYYASRWRNWAKYKTCRDLITPIPVPKYNSPIVAECQSNNIILMSDGKPEYFTANTDPKSLRQVRRMIGSDANGCETGSPFTFNSGRCGSELTHFLADNDNNPDVDDDQFINTYVIGFASGITPNARGYLESLVTVDNGYFSAQNEEQLAAAFKQTLDSIAEEARSQASPGYSVNVKSGLEHEDDIYIPVFDKRNSSRWSGNLKKFKLVEGTGPDGEEHRYIRGRLQGAANGNANGDYIDAMDELGLFEATAWDEWSASTSADGDVVSAGGTASLLTDPRRRNLYSNLTSNNLSSPQNRLKANNNNITTDMLFDRASLNLSVPDARKYKKKLVKFIRGWKDGNDGGWGDGAGHGFPEGNIPAKARKHMGDMLHSEPVVITYQTSDDQGNGKEQYIFAATNEGYLHVFNTATGVEEFAFMPKELLKNIEPQFTGEGDHLYGIDGSISYWHNDENHNGNVDGSERVLLYFGLRRGGKSYYAMDVTDIDSPQLMWMVDETTSGLSGLGQTWSMPYIANVLENGVKKPAVIFTGGNDVDQDYGEGDSYTVTSVTTDITANEGSNIYIVDAYTGSHMWDMKSAISNATDVTHAIPGGARILDVNRNGLLDRLYFADTGGDVWRLDLGEDLATGTSKLTKFASLGGSGTSSRKFYNEPDVAQLRANGQLVYTVSVGSGLRPHPMNEIIDDRMFILLDRSPLVELPDSFPAIEIGDLATVVIGTDAGSKTLTHTGGDFGVDNKRITDAEDTNGDKLKGWNVDFGDSGEKVLATSMTFEGSIYFTTLVPKALRDDSIFSICAMPATQGRIYIMDILTGEASADLDDPDSDVTDNDVFQTISASEIPGTPQTVAGQLRCTGEDCGHQFDTRIGKKLTEMHSNGVADIESIYWTDPVEK